MPPTVGSDAVSLSISVAATGWAGRAVAEAVLARPGMRLQFAVALVGRSGSGKRLERSVGSSGLSAADFQDIDLAARSAGVGVIAAGNSSITAALMQAAALLAARHMPSWEVVDYGAAGRPDAPSGTSSEMAERLSAIRAPEQISIAGTGGLPEARGATVPTQVHSRRLPGFSLSTEVVFGLPRALLPSVTTRGSSAAPYVEGTLLAATKAAERVR